MDGDFVVLVFFVVLDVIVIVLMKNEMKFNFWFMVIDDCVLDYVIINILGIDGFDNCCVDVDGKSLLNFVEIIVFFNELKSYNVIIIVFDKKENLIIIISVLNILEMLDFFKMYLVDVVIVEELNSDIFGVLMVIEYIGEY